MSRNYELLQLMEKQSAPFAVADDGVVQRIFLDHAPSPPRVVVFAAIDHGNGCSQIALSAAETLGARTCLVEANFRSPALPGMLGISNDLGLTDALQRPGDIRSFMKPLRRDGMWVLTAGPVGEDSPGLLSSESMRARIAELRREFDFVLIDAAPVSPYGDVIPLGKMSDGVVLIVEAESTRREAARAAVDHLRACRIPVLGAVLNKRTFPIPEFLYSRL